MPKKILDGLSIDYDIRTTAAKAPPLIFQHGLGGDRERAIPLIPDINTSWLSFDFPGHGHSSPLPEGAYSFSRYAALTLSMMDAQSWDDAVLGGVSMGGGVALRTALMQPHRCRGLILIRPAWRNGDMGPGIRSIFQQIGDFASMENGAEAYRSSSLYRSLHASEPATAEAFTDFFAYERRRETASKFREISTDAPYRQKKELQAIQVPTLVMACRDDIVHPYDLGKSLAEDIPGAQFVTLPAKSQNPLAYQEEASKQIRQFLRALQSV